VVGRVSASGDTKGRNVRAVKVQDLSIGAHIGVVEQVLQCCWSVGFVQLLRCCLCFVCLFGDR
jgi:hypothetical protein